MTRIVLLAGIALAAFVFTGCGSTSPSTEQTPGPSSAAPSSTTLPEPSQKVVPAGGVYWNPATRQPEAKPTEIVLTIADAGDMLVDIAWDSWTQERATGKAVRVTKDCVPDCATGGTTRRDVTLVFEASQSLPDDSGWWQFTKLIITDRDGKAETVDMPVTAE